jgi:rare lipoprotein A
VEQDAPAASEEKDEEQPARGPYEVAAKAQNPEGYSAEGLASWYGLQFHGRSTANGEVFDKASISAAHPSLPLPSYARVTNVSNGKSIVVRVNDRGPFHGGRALDVSERVAEILEFKHKGMARVRIDYVGPASLSGSDEGRLLATYRENGSLPATALASLEAAPTAKPATTPSSAPTQDRVGAAFSGFSTPQPLTRQGVMVQPVLSGFAFSPSAYNSPR